MKITPEENKIHLTFEIGLLLKGFHAILEILGGALVFLTSRTYLINKILSFTQEELREDPKDLIAHYLINTSNNFSIDSQHFIALYLLVHGLIKLCLVIGLMREKLWAYPTSIVVFSLFIVYQLYRYTNTHSIWLLLFTVFDVALIWLTLHEYRYMKKNNLFSK